MSSGLWSQVKVYRLQMWLIQSYSYFLTIMHVAEVFSDQFMPTLCFNPLHGSLTAVCGPWWPVRTSRPPSSQRPCPTPPASAGRTGRRADRRTRTRSSCESAPPESRCLARLPDCVCDAVPSHAGSLWGNRPACDRPPPPGHLWSDDASQATSSLKRVNTDQRNAFLILYLICS